MKPKAIFCNQDPRFEPGSTLAYVYARGRRERIAALTELHPAVLCRENLASLAPQLQDLEAIFSTWGMPAFTDAELDLMPRLKGVFYAAGSVKGFAEPMLRRGITVVSGWGANGIPVAEFCLAQILLANKGYFRNVREYGAPNGHSPPFRGPGNFGEKVALIGAGMVGRLLIERLQRFSLEILVVDPYLSDADAAQLGVRKVALEEAFAQAFVVSNHLPNLPSLHGVLHAGLFRAMRPGATFINTGRGAQVDEAGLIEAFTARPDLTALLDVTHPEPPVADSPLYRLPNVRLSSHIAGSINDEVVLMADYVIEEFTAWREGRPLRFAISLDQLAKMA